MHDFPLPILVNSVLERLGLSYAFSARTVQEGDNKLRVAFSKPTPQEPIPRVVVYMDIERAYDEEQLPENQGFTILKLKFEQQQLTRTLRFRVAPDLNERELQCQFSEKWIDCIYQQKDLIRNNFVDLHRPRPHLQQQQ